MVIRRASSGSRISLFSFNSTTIDLCLNLFPWAKFSRDKGVLSVMFFCITMAMPSFVHGTDATSHDVKAFQMLNLNVGFILALDMAYIDFTAMNTCPKESILSHG